MEPASGPPWVTIMLPAGIITTGRTSTPTLPPFTCPFKLLSLCAFMPAVTSWSRLEEDTTADIEEASEEAVVVGCTSRVTMHLGAK